MKTTKYLLLFVLLFSINSCGQQSTNRNQKSSAIGNEEGTDIQFLKNFYEEYLSACCKLPESYSILEDVKKKYFSNDLYKKLNIAELDYDPLLDVQDCDESWIETIEIDAVQNRKGVYQVFYNDGSNKKNIVLSLINSNGKLLINDIENNPDLSAIEVNHSEDLSIDIKGNWSTVCDESTILTIDNMEEFLLPIMSNQIYVKAKIKETRTNFYNIYLIEPDDLGSGGLQLDWDNFSKDSVIANIEILKTGTMSFNWIGFYDVSNKKLVFTDCEFNLETGTNPSLLSKCD